MLVKHGADVNASFSVGLGLMHPVTPLVMAAFFNNADGVRGVLKHGANPDTKIRNVFLVPLVGARIAILGGTALEWATAMKREAATVALGTAIGLGFQRGGRLRQSLVRPNH